MASLAPALFRPSPSLLSSNDIPSAASTSNSATPPRKPENSAAVAAGRRRLDEFQKRKAAGKSKKTPNSKASAPVDYSTQDGSKIEQGPVLSTSGDSSVPSSQVKDSNGSVSKDLRDADTHKVSPPQREERPLKVDAAAASLPLPVANPTILPPRVTVQPSFPLAGHTPAHMPITATTITSLQQHVANASDDRSSLFRPPPKSQGHPFPLATKENPSVINGSNDLNARGSLPATSVQAPVSARGAVLESFDPQRPPTSGLDGIYGSKPTVQQAAPLGATQPLFVPGPPPPRPVFTSASGPTGGIAKTPVTQVNPPPPRKDNLGILAPVLEPGKQEPVRSTLAAGAPAFSTSSGASTGSQNNIGSSSQINSINLVMLDSKLGPNKHVPDFQNHTNSRERERESAVTAKPFLSTAGIPSTKEKDTTNANNEKKPVNGTSAGSSGVNPLISSLGSSSVSKPSAIAPLPTLSEPPKILPLPPPFRPPVPPSISKPTVSVTAPGRSTFPEATTSADVSTVPSRRNSATNRIQHSAPIIPVKVLPHISAAQENGTRDVGDQYKPDLPKLSPRTGDISAGKGLGMVGNSRSSSLPSSGGDDFAMLEQYIEDLTQEKFSLKRGLESSKALVDTLAQENSSLTEDYNKQGALVNELKAETDKQQGEIRAQAVVVRNMKNERDRAVQESMSAVQRSQAFAAEVITLEEKVLRARSQQLKLEREMETLNAAAATQTQQLSSLEKDRANLKTLIDALQEEKGLMQTQIRNASAGGSSPESSRSSNRLLSASATKSDVSTSTDDLDHGTRQALGAVSVGEAHVTAAHGPLGVQDTGLERSLEQHRSLPMIVPSLPSRPLLSPSHRSRSPSYSNESGSMGNLFTLGSSATSGRPLNLGPMSSILPPDQAATIRNIDSLITELGEEKEAILKALRAESTGAAELRALNSELSHKLEVQTQRLELAVAQSMAYGSTPRVGNSYAVPGMAPEYVDEGDEVVDRVLGWILRLFPSGSSRRKRL